MSPPTSVYSSAQIELRPVTSANRSLAAPSSFLSRVQTAAFVCSALLAVESQAAMIITNSVRTLTSSNNKGSSQTVETLADGLFNDVSRVDWVEYWAPRHRPWGGFTTGSYGSYFSTAKQESSVSASGISAKGSVTGTGTFDFWGTQPLFQTSTSYFEIDFTIDAPCTVVLTGVLDFTYDNGGSNEDTPQVWLILSGVNGVVYSEHIDIRIRPGFFPVIQKQINETFDSLAVGQYSLVAYATTGGFYSDQYGYGGVGGYGHASYDITLIPEPSHFLLACLGGLVVLTRRVRSR